MSSENVWTNLASLLESYSFDDVALSLTSAPSTAQERRERAKEARKLQLEAYQQWQAQLKEEEEERVIGTGTSRWGQQPKERCRRRVCFQPRERLRDAVVRADREEGEFYE